MPAEHQRYIEVTALTAPGHAEAVADILRSLADSGAWIERPFSQRSLEQDARVDVNAPVRVHVYFRGDDATANAGLVAPALRAAGLDAEVSRRDVQAADWAEAWKEHFQVERYGRRLVVAPSWRAFAPASGDVVIRLDPGMAFGTGQHETTRLCLEALEACGVAGRRVLDLGCGSGILAIAAAKLGAGDVLAVDIDADCVRITKDNVRLNGVERVVHARHGSVETASGGAPFGLVIANIIAGVLIDLAPAIRELLGDEGRLLASGIISERRDEVIAAFEAAGLTIAGTRALGEWRLIEAVARRAADPLSHVEPMRQHP